MFLFGWIRRLFSWFRFSQSAAQSVRILILGLDDAGKTTLLESIASGGEFRQVEKTVAPNQRTINIGSVQMSAFDLGGHRMARASWRDYFADVAGVVFMIDSSNAKRFDEARAELRRVLSDPLLPNVPFLVLGNKVDVAGSVSFADISDLFRLDLCYGETRDFGGARAVHLVMTSVPQRFGIVQGFRWLASVVSRRE